MRGWALGMALVIGTAGGVGQGALLQGAVAKAGSADVVAFDFEHAGLEPPHWGFEIHTQDGRGRYVVRGAPREGNASGDDWREVTVSPKLIDVLLGAEAWVAAGRACETRAKNIAKTGKKKLSYGRGDAVVACEFNYSEEESVQKAADAFQAMAETMQYGERLKRERRFDRLGLDAEMTLLEDAVKGGRAIEVQNIAPILQGIVDDERVMERVRRKAARLVGESVGMGPGK